MLSGPLKFSFEEVYCTILNPIKFDVKNEAIIELAIPELKFCTFLRLLLSLG